MMTLALIAALIQADATRCDSMPPSVIDAFHPRYFVTVFEQVSKTRSDTILSQQSRCRGGQMSMRVAEEEIDYEVDLHSKVFLVFDREWIWAQQGSRIPFEGEILVTGKVRGANEVRNIEVPGYSVVGQPASFASARILSLRELLGSLSDAQHALAEVRDTVEKILLLVEVPGPHALRTGVDKANLAAARRRILTDSVRLLAPLRKLTDTLNSILVEAVAHVARRDDNVLRGTALEVISIWLPLLRRSNVEVDTTRATADSAFWAIRQISDVVRSIVELIPQDSLPLSNFRYDVGLELLSSLKDTDLLVAETGAKPGETIVLTITNAVAEERTHRTLTISLKVVEFGLLRKTSDSFLFANRLGVNAEANQLAVQTARDSALRSGTTVTVETPKESRYAPAAGVSLGWTFVARRNSPMGPLMRWLQPGFGVNVSFLSFATTATTFTAVTVDTLTSTTVTDRSNTVDLGAGVFISFFNDAIQFSYGINLTSDRPRGYLGVGFGFVSLVERFKRTS